MNSLFSLFKKVYRESVDDDEFSFYEVDLTNLKVRFPSGVSDVMLALSDDHIFRLSYNLNGNEVVKYFYDDDRGGFKSRNIALRYAEQDAAIEDDPNNHIKMVRHSRGLDSAASPIPMPLVYDIVRTAKAQFPDGKCNNKSKHINDNATKDWHNVVPDEIFDSWASRVINKVPSNIDYLSEEIGYDKIIIPINLAYKGVCKELSTVGKFAREKLKHFGLSMKKDYVVKFGLVRVYSFVNNEILTEFLFNASPKKVQTWNLINTDDTNAEVWGLERFSKEQIDGIVKATQNELKYYCGVR